VEGRESRVPSEQYRIDHDSPPMLGPGASLRRGVNHQLKSQLDVHPVDAGHVLGPALRAQRE
jgi:hypothetical protein